MSLTGIDQNELSTKLMTRLGVRVGVVMAASVTLGVRYDLPFITLGQN